MTDDQLLALYVERETQRIDAEHGWPTIAAALTHTRNQVAAAWPNVTIMGIPYTQGGKQIAEAML